MPRDEIRGLKLLDEAVVHVFSVATKMQDPKAHLENRKQKLAEAIKAATKEDRSILGGSDS